MNVSIKEVLAKSEPPKSLKQHVDECLSVQVSLKMAFERLPVNDLDHFLGVSSVRTYFS